MAGVTSSLGRRDPLSRVMALGNDVAARAITVAVIFTLLFHGAAMARTALIPLDLIHWSDTVRAQIRERLLSSYDIDIVKVAVPEPPPQQEEPPPEPKAPAPPPPKAEKAEVEKEPPPPPAAAQAGAVLTDPNEPVDFTGDGFVTGTSATFAGGVTATNGTSNTAVRNLAARPEGVKGGTGTAPQPAKPDQSRAAARSGSSDWKCPWPSEADAEQIDDAYVTVQVSVKPDGHASQVNVLSDPGHGFGREARMCAMREKYDAAHDRDGNPIAGDVKAFRIHFER